MSNRPSEEPRTIQVKAYRTPYGRPTCCSSWLLDRCVFLEVRQAGGCGDQVPICKATGADLEYDDKGWVIPCDGCPVLGEEVPGE